MEGIIALATLSTMCGSYCVYKCCWRRYEALTPPAAFNTNALRDEWGLTPVQSAPKIVSAAKD
jgi:hypothetical protein